jgi:hypothetical protein
MALASVAVAGAISRSNSCGLLTSPVLAHLIPLARPAVALDVILLSEVDAVRLSHPVAVHTVAVPLTLVVSDSHAPIVATTATNVVTR